ncbi:MAG: SDR family NAD(P)-dependent oxidoreductase [Deltaproteobacteria bacterium]|nr:MAG: SDR family NAD(P)-dependent oxidoreductase [Deltaproteobacteria bacterium]
MSRSAVVIGVGARAGLGAALCRRFAREGLHVFLAGRTGQTLGERAAELGGAEAATPVIADATVEADAVRLFDRVAERGGAPEIVVYNAGNNRFRPLLEMDVEFFEGLWRLCCLGGFLIGREAARRMVPAGGGTLIFTGATASIRARPPFTAFASAKAALRALAHGMAREFGAKGLHVGHVIIDGIIDGDAVNRRFPQLKAQRGEDGMLSPDAIADAYWALHAQERSAWTLELDLRPYKETF